MKNLFNYFAIGAFVAIFIGMIYAFVDSTNHYEKMKEQKRIEKILEQRREKIDSLRDKLLIEYDSAVEGFVEGKNVSNHLETIDCLKSELLDSYDSIIMIEIGNEDGE